MKHSENERCCCNCIHQKKLMKHPSNRHDFAKGSILDQMGFTCNVTFEDQSNKGSAYFFDEEHGECELHNFRKV